MASVGALGSLPKPPTRPAIQVFGTGEGLPSTTVHDIRQDPQGRVWVGTNDGVAVYNGRHWNAVALPGASGSKWVRALCQTADGSLWLGLDDGGLWRKQGEAWTHFGQEVLGSLRVNALLELRDAGGASTLWVGSGAGILKYEGGTWTRQTEAMGCPEAWVWHLSEGRGDGGARTLWASTRKGLARLEAGAWRTFTTRDGLPGDEINASVAWQEPGGGWTEVASCWGHGLARWDGATWSPFKDATGLPGRFIVSLAVSQSLRGPTLWAGSYDEGLFGWNAGAWSRLTVADGLPSNAIYSLLPEPSRRPALWIGTRGGGLATLDLAGWRVIDRSMGLPSDDATAFVEGHDAQGRPALLLGTAKGIMAWDGRRWSDQGPTASSIHPHAYSLYESPDGRLFMGSVSGLAIREKGQWTLKTRTDGLPQSRVVCIVPSRDGGQLVGTSGGLARFRDGRIELVALPPPFAQAAVYAIFESHDAAGATELWVGTRGDGLLHCSGGRWSSVGPAQGFPSKSIYALLRTTDAQGRRWLLVGTAGTGLMRLQLDAPGAAWERYDLETLPGFPSNTVASLGVDPQGRILMGTKRGVVRLTLGDGAPRLETYSSGDGLPSLSCNSAGLLVDAQGLVWIGTPQGAAVLDPALEEPMPRLPRPYLDQVRIAGVPTRLEPGARLGHRQNHLAFTFGIARFQREESIRFRTQLEGLEAAPGAWTTDEVREFAALPRGSYNLVVWAQDHLGHTSQPLSFAFEVKAAPWRTPLAFMLYTALGAAAMLGLHRLRVRILEEQNRTMAARIDEHTARLRQNQQELEELNDRLVQLNQAKNIFLGIAAHDLKSPLTALALEGELLQDPSLPSDFVVERGGKIREVASRMSQLVSKLLDVHAIESRRLDLKLAPVDLIQLIRDIRQGYEQMARSKVIRVELQVPDSELLVLADPTHLREVLENLVSNALKFTPPGPPERSLWIRANREGSWAILEVEDQGPGFTDADKRQAFESFARLSARPTAGEDSTGLGLSIVKNLVEAMGGTVALASVAGEGATFRIELPVA